MSEKPIEIDDKKLALNYGALTSANPSAASKIDNSIRDVMRAGINVVPDLVSSLKPRELYRIKSMPDGATILVDKAGDLIGTTVKDGKIAGPLRLEKMGPQFAQLAKGIAQQVVLVHIANELREIKAEIRQIASGLHDDRVAKIEAGLKMLERAHDFESKRQCIPVLQEGIIQVTKELYADLSRVPKLKAGFFDNWFGESKTEELEHFFKRVRESFYSVVKGYEGLFLCYDPHCQIKESVDVVKDYKNFMDNLDFNQILEICRHLPISSYPEDVWKKLTSADNRNEYFQQLEVISLGQIEECCVAIKGEELKELCHEL